VAPLSCRDSTPVEADGRVDQNYACAGPFWANMHGDTPSPRSTTTAGAGQRHLRTCFRIGTYRSLVATGFHLLGKRLRNGLHAVQTRVTLQLLVDLQSIGTKVTSATESTKRAKRPQQQVRRSRRPRPSLRWHAATGWRACLASPPPSTSAGCAQSSCMRQMFSAPDQAAPPGWPRTVVTSGRQNPGCMH
jgi:hypothetical protein